MTLDSPHIQLLESPGSHTLLVAFADMAGRFGMPPLLFMDLISPLPAHKLTLRDPFMAWYLKGVPGAGHNPEAVTAALKDLCRRLEINRLVTIGNSAGAYAAILFGVLLQADEVHAFGPQTRLLHMNDSRYPEHIRQLIREAECGAPYRNLTLVLNRRPQPRARIRLYYSRFDRLDRRHAERLRSISSVTLIPRPVVGHSLMMVFYQNGLLKKLLTAAVTGRDSDIRREASNHTGIDLFRSSRRHAKMVYSLRFRRSRFDGTLEHGRARVLLVYPKGGPPSELAPLGIPLLKATLLRNGVPAAALDLQTRGVRTRQGLHHLINRWLPRTKAWSPAEAKARLVSLFDPLLRPLRGRRRLHRLTKGRSIRTIIAAALDAPLHHSDFRRLTRCIEQQGIDLVGFSVVYPEQLFHALLLARLLKQWRKGINILLGGAQVTKHIGFLVDRNALSDVVDGLVVNEGEEALRAYVDQMGRGGDFDTVPHLYHADGKGAFRKSRARTPRLLREDVLADFRDFRFAVLPLRASVGCPWGKCSFCTYRLFHQGYEKADPHQMVRTMRSLQRTYRVSYFRIVDDFLTPAFLERFSTSVIRAGLKVQWWSFLALVPGFSRRTASLMKQAGCRSVETGLESMSPRILKLMGKPHTPEQAQTVFRVLHEAGIDICVDVMFGFPTETESEARETLDYLTANRHLFKSINIQQFCLEEHTDIFRSPATYGIERIDTTDKSWGIRKGFPFKASSGMTLEESRRFTEAAARQLA